MSAATIPDKTLIISAEAGLLSLAAKEIDMIDISQDDDGNVLPKEKRIERLQVAYRFLLSEESREKYKWVFIDSITEISQNMVETLQKEFPDRKDSLVLYGENAKRMRALIKAFRDLPYYNIIFTALCDEDKDESGKRIKTISMVGKVAGQIAGYMDEVFYLHCEENEEGGIERKFITQPTDRLICKDRSGKLNRFEPPDFEHIYNKINA